MPIPAFLLVTMELLGSVEVQVALAAISQLKGARLRDAWEEMATSVQEAVKTTAAELEPYPLDWRGGLIASIDHEVIVDGDAISAVIFSDLFYAAIMERGHPPYWPSISALEEWASDHGVTAYWLARQIATRGIEARKFMEQTAVQMEDEIVKKVGQVVLEVIEGKP